MLVHFPKIAWNRLAEEQNSVAAALLCLASEQNDDASEGNMLAAALLCLAEEQNDDASEGNMLAAARKQGYSARNMLAS